MTKEKLVQEQESYKKSNEELRQSNTRYNKDIEKFREKYTELDARIRDFDNQNDQLSKDNDHFLERLDDLQKQLAERESIINQKEQQIKEFRNKNIHLQNFRSVYDHRVSTLNEEHGPLVEHLENMEKHIKTIYKELLDEANSNKRLREQLLDKKGKITDLGESSRVKGDILSVFRRANELFEYDIVKLTRDTNFEVWEEPLKEIKETYDKRLKHLDAILFSKPENMGSVFENYKDKGDETQKKNVQQAIREELMRQRDFMNKKLLSVSKFNENAEDEREGTYIRIQNENTNLINECNFLRKEKHLIQNKIGMMEKQARDLARDLNDSYLDAYRSKAAKSVKLGGGDDHIQSSPGQSLPPNLLRNSKELPFKKYHSEKQLPPTTMNGTNVKKMYTNEILYSLMKEIDKYNETNSNVQNTVQKLFQTPDTKSKYHGGFSDQHTADYSGSQALLSPQKIEASPNVLADTPVKNLKSQHAKNSDSKNNSLRKSKP
jgi:hypothetical protein